MRRFFATLIKLYQIIKPTWINIQMSIFGFAPVCHQTPSCSEFTRQEILKHGTIVGLKNGLWRALHCHSLRPAS